MGAEPTYTDDEKAAFGLVTQRAVKAWSDYIERTVTPELERLASGVTIAHNALERDLRMHRDPVRTAESVGVQGGDSWHGTIVSPKPATDAVVALVKVGDMLAKQVESFAAYCAKIEAGTTGGVLPAAARGIESQQRNIERARMTALRQRELTAARRLASVPASA